MHMAQLWLPFVVLIAVWVLFSIRLGKRSAKIIDLISKQNEVSKQIAASLERIANALETRR